MEDTERACTQEPHRPSTLSLPWDISVPDSWAFRLRLGLIPLASLTLRPLGLDWNYTTSFPGPPACIWQIVGLLSLHYHMSQSLIINLSARTCWPICFARRPLTVTVWNQGSSSYIKCCLSNIKALGLSSKTGPLKSPGDIKSISPHCWASDLSTQCRWK